MKYLLLLSSLLSLNTISSNDQSEIINQKTNQVNIGSHVSRIIKLAFEVANDQDKSNELKSVYIHISQAESGLEKNILIKSLENSSQILAKNKSKLPANSNWDMILNKLNNYIQDIKIKGKSNIIIECNCQNCAFSDACNNI